LLKQDSPDRSGRAVGYPDRRRRRRRRGLVILLVLVLALAGLTARLFVWPATGMPAHVDAIVVLDGPGHRLPTALRLARARRASYLVISQGTPASRDNTPCPRAIPRTRVICFHPSPPTTRGEIEYAGRLAARYHWQSVVVVAMAPQQTPARIRLSRCFSGRIYAMTSPLPLRSWPYQVGYEWGATINALLLQRAC
jgi:uncharacterized SAM-binding protein YcdF (DUF218 family)